MLAEIFKIAAVVENEKPPLVRVLPVDLIGAGQALTKPGAPSNHLPELGLGAHLLKEHQIHALGHVNACVHHVHGHRNVGGFVGDFKVVNDGLGIGVVTHHPLGKGAVVLGVELIEPLDDKLRMAFVLGKDDGFAQTVPARHMDAPLHEVLEHRVHGDLVEYELIQCRRGDEVGHVPVLVKVLLVPLLVLRGQVIVHDALFQKLGLYLVVVIRHQYMVLIDGGLVVIGISGHLVLHLKEVVGVPVHVGLGGGGEAHQNGVEILENGPVLLENTAVALVNDDEVKVGGGKQPPPVPGPGLVNGVEHGGIGGKDDAGLSVVLVGAQITQGHVGQIVFEIVLGLLDQGGAVGQKQNVGHIVASAEHVGEAGGGAGLARPGGHHQQMLAESLFQLLAHRPNGLFLVVAVGDLVVNGHRLQLEPLGAAVHELLQVLPAENPAHRPLGPGGIVPEIGLTAVGGEHHGAASKLPFQTVGVLHRLGAPIVGVPAGALGLDDRQRQAILSKEHIVHKAGLSHHPRHVFHGVLLLYVRLGAVKLPAHLLQVHVNELLPGLELGEVVGGKGALLLVLLLLGGVLGGELGHLLPQGLNLRLFLVQQALLLAQLGLVHHLLLRRDLGRVKGALFIVRPITIVQPLDKLKEGL